ncbi:MAG: ShlB/FhaC/HecB family hemolysin secretion/activation protein [Cyanobacteria bacterium P01_B01_bin.77]
MNAELTSGSSPGLSLLILDVQEARPFDISFTADNYRAPSTGSEQGTASASYTNILGLGDRLSGSFSLSEGLNLYDIGYEVPINASNGIVRARLTIAIAAIAAL